MSTVDYRANLSAKQFPLLTEQLGATVIVKGADQSYQPQLSLSESADKDVGIPQVYYAHNMLPSSYGLQSVGYEQFVFPYIVPASFVSVHTVRDGAGNVAHIAIDSAGLLYKLVLGNNFWVLLTRTQLVPEDPVPSIAGKNVTTAYVSGVTYVYFANVGCYVYDFDTGAFNETELTELVPTAIIGIVGNSGYLIAYSSEAIAWSSTLDPTDFTPSLDTGAGGGSAEGAKGAIVAAVSIYGGFILFTTSNALACTYSKNPRFPFDFTEIPGAGGLADPSYAAYDTNSTAVYAYTTSGLQSVTMRSASMIFPEITDYLSGSYFEDFNDTTLEFSISNAPQAIKKRVVVVSNRYVVISYGILDLTHAIVIDTAYKQFGRLKIAHTDCFEFGIYAANVYETPKKSMAFLQKDGSVFILNSDENFLAADGTLICGKYQYVRSRLLQLQGVDVESVREDATFRLYTLPSLDGKDLLPAVEGYMFSTGTRSRSYRFHNTAKNHSILFRGKFNAVSLVLNFNIHGGR